MRTPWKILEKWLAQARAQATPEVADGAAAQTSKLRGEQAEDAALHYLQQQGLRLLARNYRTPGRGGGEIDLVMKERDGTLVFVEVKARATAREGAGLLAVSARKQNRLLRLLDGRPSALVPHRQLGLCILF